MRLPYRNVLAAAIVVSLSLYASAGTFTLDGTADGSSVFVEYFSNAYAQLGLEPDGFYDLDTDALLAPEDVFAAEGDFADVVSVTYDDVTGVVTGVTTNFNAYIADNDATLDFSYDESASVVSGTVTLVESQPVDVEFVATVTFTYDFSGFPGGPVLPYVGTLTVNNGAFDLFVDAPQYSNVGGFNLRYTWAASGTAVIPEPASLGLLAVGLLLVQPRRASVP